MIINMESSNLFDLFWGCDEIALIVRQPYSVAKHVEQHSPSHSGSCTQRQMHNMGFDGILDDSSERKHVIA